MSGAISVLPAPTSVLELLEAGVELELELELLLPQAATKNTSASAATIPVTAVRFLTPGKLIAAAPFASISLSWMSIRRAPAGHPRVYPT